MYFTLLQIVENENSTEQEGSQTGFAEGQRTETVSVKIHQPVVDNEQAGHSRERNKEQSHRAIELEQTTPTNSKTTKRTPIRQLHSIVQDMISISHNINNEEEEANEFDAFGKYVGIQLKSLLEEDAIVAQQEIQSILTSYKLKKIRRRRDSEYLDQRNQSPLSDY